MNVFVFQWQWNESIFYLSHSLQISNDPYPLEITVGGREIGKELKKKREIGEHATIWQKHESKNLPFFKHQKVWLELFLSPDTGGRDDNSPSH